MKSFLFAPKIPAWTAALAIILAVFLPTTAPASTLRPGDKVEIRLGGVPQEEIMAVSAVYTIDAEGFINLPHIGKLKAAGLMQHELQQNIENRYRTEEIYTRPTITINQQLGDRFVNVDGEVRMRTRVPYTPDMTLLSAINAAGGVNEFADQRRVQLSRDGHSEVYDLRRLRRDPSLDVPVQPGDNIFVPRSFW
jgi:polysaccharide export outer membrane protein